MFRNSHSMGVWYAELYCLVFIYPGLAEYLNKEAEKLNYY